MNLTCRLSAGPLLALVSLTATAQRPPLIVEHGRYTVHLLLHAIGYEEYTLTDEGSSGLHMTAITSVADRGTTRASTLNLTMRPDFSPTLLTQSTCPAPTSTAPVTPVPDCISHTEITPTSATIHEATLDLTRTFPKPPVAFVGFTTMPASLQMIMMRYWALHHRPARLTILRASDQALPVEIRLVGHDVFETKGRRVRLTRYTVANLLFGREVLWMNDSGRLAALMTFAGGLPQEELLEGYEPVAGEIVHSGVRQQMLDLDELTRQNQPSISGTFALTGARLIDGTGTSALPNATVLIQSGRIAAAGPAASVRIPPGTRIVRADGKFLIPGLWEMHIHESGVAFGPALLAAGITTARDCGGEPGFLLALRDRLNQHQGLGPRLLLAGLIDSGGPLAFGPVQVESPAEAITAVDNYADWRFEQIKVYTQIQPEVLKVITAEAHRRGLTVTGHVPAAVDTPTAIADGMDQINHLQFITRAMNPDPSTGKIDLQSPKAQQLIALLNAKQIVVDPTLGWGEMAGHPRSLNPATFEPGLLAAPFTLASKYRALGSAADPAAFATRLATNREVVHALADAGVPLVAGSDTGLPGYGLDRELELYVQAGLTPMAALQTATRNAARAMRLDADSGTIEPGKRADLVLLDADPLENIANIRRVASVIHDGRLYDSRKLAHNVGFTR